MKTMIDNLPVSFPVWEVLEDESLLVHSAQSGDLDAFNAIVLKYQGALYNLAVRILEQEQAASDALQEALISAFQHLQDFHGGSLKAWLMRIVVNKCYDQVRRRRSIAAISMNETLNDESENENELFYQRLQHPPASVEEQVESRQFRESIQQCLSRLPVDFRTIVMLVDVEEMSYTEVAAVLHIPIGTVKSRLARARYDLRRKLKACLCP
jgi:RNA polymerase sigma factor (sigma-70 family)